MNSGSIIFIFTSGEKQKVNVYRYMYMCVTTADFQKRTMKLKLTAIDIDGNNRDIWSVLEILWGIGLVNDSMYFTGGTAKN